MSQRPNYAASLRRDVLVTTVTGNILRSSEIARARPISIGGRPFTEVRGPGGTFLGVIGDPIGAVMASVSMPKGARR